MTNKDFFEEKTGDGWAFERQFRDPLAKGPDVNKDMNEYKIDLKAEQKVVLITTKTCIWSMYTTGQNRTNKIANVIGRRDQSGIRSTQPKPFHHARQNWGISKPTDAHTDRHRDCAG